MNYEYDWRITVEVIADTEQESKEKLKKFKSELFNRYGVTDDVWMISIKKSKGRGGQNLKSCVED